jgi:hypothetical protein
MGYISKIQQMGGGKKNTNGSSAIAEHSWNTVCTNLFFPQAVSKHTVNTCWKGSFLLLDLLRLHDIRVLRVRSRADITCYMWVFPSPMSGLHRDGHRLSLSGHS